LALLSGCSATRVLYSNADAFLRWQADSYFGFEGEQSDELDARIAAFLAWHRAKALPQYARLAGEAGERLARGLSREDLVWGYDSFQSQARESLRAAAAEMADLLDRLTPEQIDRLERRLAEENRKFAREHLQGTVRERHERRLAQNLERLEEWFGSLSEEQVERVRRYSEGAPRIAELRDRERRRLQKELVAMLRAREAKQRLADWAPNWDRGREPAYAAGVRQMRDQYFRMLLDLDRTLSPAQRQAAVARLREYAAEFESLVRR
jgi:hypothetical protein